MLWSALILIMTVLVVTNAISGYATVAFSVAIIAFCVAELLLKRKVRGKESWTP